MQEVIVYIILVIVAAILVCQVYRQVTGKRRGCHCDGCPHCKDGCAKTDSECSNLF